MYTDNQNVVRITNTGSMKSELQSLAIEIFNLCIRKTISLEVEWIPREQNQNDCNSDFMLPVFVILTTF
jgi:hypothetical protein